MVSVESSPEKDYAKRVERGGSSQDKFESDFIDDDEPEYFEKSAADSMDDKAEKAFSDHDEQDFGDTNNFKFRL